MNERSPNYDGCAVHPAFGDEAVPGSIRVEAQALLFESAAGNCGMPLERVSIGPGTGGQICFSDPEQPEWEVLTGDESILKDFFLMKRARLQAQIRELRWGREGRRMLKYAAAFILTFAAAAGLAVGVSGLALGAMVKRTPVAWENELGRAAFNDLTNTAKVMREPAWPAWFSSVTNRLPAGLPRHPYRFEFFMVDSEMPNAFALPGGKILVCKGLLKLAQSPEELAGVLAHEMAHVLRRHGLRHVLQGNGPFYVLRVFVGERNLLALVTGGSQVVLSQSFSREHEREADASAWRYLVAARIDPRGLTTFLERVAADPLERSFDERVPDILKSHPPPQERIAHLRELWQQCGEKGKFEAIETDNTKTPNP